MAVDNTESEILVDVANGKTHLGDVEPSNALDALVRLNFTQNMQVKGKPPVVSRETRESVTLERFLTFYIDSFLEGQKDRLIPAYARITNKMSDVNANVIYRASRGACKINEDDAREYCKTRKLKGVFKDKPAPKKKAETSVQEDKKEDNPNDRGSYIGLNKKNKQNKNIFSIDKED